jgi:ABC-type sugar transport system permease subunit
MAIAPISSVGTQVAPSARMRRKSRAGYLFIAPAMLLYIYFVVYPFLISIYYSFLKWNGAAPAEFIGLQNYQRLFSDELLGRALTNNLIWVVIGTISPIAISLLLGALLWRGVRGMAIFRTIYFLPVVLSEVVVAITWNWINLVLQAIGLGSLARGWLGDPNTALLALLVTAIWSYFGFAFVVIMAGLQDVSMDIIEAALIDGANGWQRFVHVMLPELRHVITMITSITLIGGFSVFGIVFVMTRGGPGTSTQVIATYTYRAAFQENDIGYGATLSLVMTVITLVASYIFIRLRERGDN